MRLAIRCFLISWCGASAAAFLASNSPGNALGSTRTCQLPFWSSSSSSSRLLAAGGGSGEVGSGPNWIQRSFPVDTDDSTKVDPKTVIDYDLGISGTQYQIGPLSHRMFEAIESKSSILKGASAEVKRGFLIYTMDFTAKEAVKAALTQNGLELVLVDEEQDEGIWADIDSIKLLNDEGKPIPGQIYDSWEEAVDQWAPGISFDFVARQVPAKMRELSLEELLQALDPDGELRQQAKGAGMTLPDEDIASLKDMANVNVRRTEMAPRETTNETTAFAGEPERRGYQVIRASNLLTESMNADGTENEKVLMHVMDSLVNHGCLIVDVSDGSSTSSVSNAQTMSSMWSTAQTFFENTSLEERTAKISGMTSLEEIGSPHAKVGFASYNDGNMQFLETRVDRDGQLYPQQARDLLGENGCQALVDSFNIIAQAGKDIVRIVIGASARETGVLDGVQAAEMALLAANKLLDDGKSLKETTIEHNEGSVSMSPHRLCMYSNKYQSSSSNENKNNKKEKKKQQSQKDSDTKEIFGAHTDSTFVTAVPVSAISGLEVFDEDCDEWYRPELAARRFWQQERVQKGLDPNALTELVNGIEIPWHAKYVVFMPGELLQLMSRNEVMAAVHRVVATRETESRLSAPILLRGRNGMRVDTQRYIGGFTSEDLVLQECDGMTIEQIHDAMQPTSFQ